MAEGKADPTGARQLRTWLVAFPVIVPAIDNPIVDAALQAAAYVIIDDCSRTDSFIHEPCVFSHHNQLVDAISLSGSQLLQHLQPRPDRCTESGCRSNHIPYSFTLSGAPQDEKHVSIVRRWPTDHSEVH
jgi:hypothetical protein